MEKFYNLKAVTKILGNDLQKLSGKTILWTGTSGFLGQWVLRIIKHLNQFELKTPCKLLAYEYIESIKTKFKNKKNIKFFRPIPFEQI